MYFSARSAWVLPGVAPVRRCQARFRVVTNGLALSGESSYLLITSCDFHLDFS
jgi:hypothetical protein